MYKHKRILLAFLVLVSTGVLATVMPHIGLGQGVQVQGSGDKELVRDADSRQCSGARSRHLQPAKSEQTGW
jgi:hypothetical protein